MLEQLGVHLAQPFLGETHVPHQPRAARDIQHHPRQRFVHRRVRFAVAADPGLVAERLGDALADRDRRILGGVVLVDMQVADDAAGNVDQRMARELLDHVVEKADPGRDLKGPGAIEVHLDGNVGFMGLAGYPGGSHGQCP